MDWIDRYVEAVTAKLRPKRRDEVERELRASILDALEARGGSPGSEADVTAVLAELGDPARVAAGYEPGSQYLIGPELYPLFRRVVGVTLMTLVGASALWFAVALILGGPAEFRAGDLLRDTIETALGAAILAVVVIVAAFAWLQRSEVQVPARGRLDEKWDPRSLPAVSGPERASRFDSVVGLVAAAVVLVILGGIGQAAAEALPTAAAAVRPILRHAVLHGVMVLQAAAALSALAHAVALIQGRWRPYTRAMRLVADALAVFVFVRAPVELIVHRAALLESDLPRDFVLSLILTSVVTGAIGTAIIVGLSVRAWRGRKDRSVEDLPPVSSPRLPIAAAALLFAAGITACATSSDATRDVAPDALQGTTWRLVRFEGGDGTVLTPDDGAKYTLDFQPDGSLAVRVDCNRGSGTWTSDGPAHLSFGPLALTRAMCAPGSLHDRIVRDFDYIRSYVIHRGHLFLSLMADGGIYEYEPLPAEADA